MQFIFIISLKFCFVISLVPFVLCTLPSISKEKTTTTHTHFEFHLICISFILFWVFKQNTCFYFLLLFNSLDSIGLLFCFTFFFLSFGIFKFFFLFNAFVMFLLLLLLFLFLLLLCLHVLPLIIDIFLLIICILCVCVKNKEFKTMWISSEKQSKICIWSFCAQFTRIAENKSTNEILYAFDVDL